MRGHFLRAGSIGRASLGHKADARPHVLLAASGAGWLKSFATFLFLWATFVRWVGEQKFKSRGVVALFLRS